MHLPFAAPRSARSARSAPVARDAARLRRLALSLGLALAAATAGAIPVAAQQRDTTRAPAPRPAGPDTTRRDTTRAAAPRRAPRRAATAPTTLPDSLTRPPISPRRAFLYSFVVPGYGQTRLRRQKAAALFSSVELGAWFMVLKSQNDLRVAEAARADSVFTGKYTAPTAPSTDSLPIYSPNRLTPRIKARRVHVEDWIAVVIFNHLFAGADAFVAAQLWDLPAQVSLRPAPRGGVAVTAAIAF